VTSPQPVHKDFGWRLFARTIVARSYPRLIGQQRQRAAYVFEVTLPLAGLCAYIYVYRALQAPDEFVGFVILGGAMSAFWLNVLWAMANQLYIEKQFGNLPLYVMSPTSLMAVLLGMAVGGMLTTALRAVAILLLGTWIFGVTFAVSDWWALAGIFVLGLTSLYSMGMMCASVFLLYGREGWHLVHAAQEPVYLVSGLYFPVNTFPRAVAISATLIPLTLALDGLRQVTLPGGAANGLLPVGTEIVVLLVLSIVFTEMARRLIAYTEYLARTEGRLTDPDGG
jgi:ABC-2 type transport system permease protein